MHCSDRPIIQTFTLPPPNKASIVREDIQRKHLFFSGIASMTEKKNSDDDNDGCNDKYDDSDGNFDDNYDKNY